MRPTWAHLSSAYAVPVFILWYVIKSNFILTKHSLTTGLNLKKIYSYNLLSFKALNPLLGYPSRRWFFCSLHPHGPPSVHEKTFQNAFLSLVNLNLIGPHELGIQFALTWIAPQSIKWDWSVKLFKRGLSWLYVTDCLFALWWPWLMALTGMQWRRHWWIEVVSTSCGAQVPSSYIVDSLKFRHRIIHCGFWFLHS